MNLSIAGANSGTKGVVSPSDGAALGGAEAARRGGVSAGDRAVERVTSGVLSPPLVIVGKSALTPPLSPSPDLLDIAEKTDDFLVYRKKLYLLQRTAKKLLPSHPVGGCLWNIARGETGVDVEYSPSTGRARYRKLQTCGSVWVCPICALIVAERRAEEIRLALAKLADDGGSAAFATFTVSHGRGDSLERVLEGFLAAFRWLTGRRAYQHVRSRYGVLGSIRVLESTHGRNGWHPHSHVLFCFDRVLSEVAVGCVADDVYPLWQAACAREGLVMNRRYGLHMVPAYGTVEAYLAKFGRSPKWDISREMAKGHVKSGRSVAGAVQLTPMQLLEAAHEGDERCGRLFAEFAARFNGKAQIYWSPGLRARLLPGDTAVSDAEVVAASDEAARVALEMTSPEWEAVKKVPHGRPRVLGLVEVERGGSDLARAFVAEALALYPGVVPRDLAKLPPELRAAVDVLVAEQRERNRWRGPVSAAGGAE